MTRIRITALVLVVLAGAAFVLTKTAEAGQAPIVRPTPVPGQSQVELGSQLYAANCMTCHGIDGRGSRGGRNPTGTLGAGPSLRGVGALAADFYLRTGRMPLAEPDQQPMRADPIYDEDEIAALVAYVGSLGGPPVPSIDTAGADLARGRLLFTENCAGCHQVVGQGGVMPGAVPPDLQQSTPLDVAEATHIGPYVMPKFDQLHDDEVADIAAYVTSTRDLEDRGGWGIGHIGPIPEGMVAWLLAGAAVLITIRLIGERTTR